MSSKYKKNTCIKFDSTGPSVSKKNTFENVDGSPI